MPIWVLFQKIFLDHHQKPKKQKCKKHFFQFFFFIFWDYHQKKLQLNVMFIFLKVFFLGFVQFSEKKRTTTGVVSEILYFTWNKFV